MLSVHNQSPEVSKIFVLVSFLTYTKLPRIYCVCSTCPKSRSNAQISFKILLYDYTYTRNHSIEYILRAIFFRHVLLFKVRHAQSYFSASQSHDSILKPQVCPALLFLFFQVGFVHWLVPYCSLYNVSIHHLHARATQSLNNVVNTVCAIIYLSG